MWEAAGFYRDDMFGHSKKTALRSSDVISAMFLHFDRETTDPRELLFASTRQELVDIVRARYGRHGYGPTSKLEKELDFLVKLGLLHPEPGTSQVSYRLDTMAALRFSAASMQESVDAMVADMIKEGMPSDEAKMRVQDIGAYVMLQEFKRLETMLTIVA